MKENKNDWRQGVSIAKLPKIVLFGIIFTLGSLTFAQTSSTPMARMTSDNSITIRTGLHAVYTVSVGHLAFTSQQEAVAYFQAREVDYIDFVVIDVKNVQMHFDLTNPAVSSWTLADWNQALATRAANCAPRTISTSNN